MTPKPLLNAIVPLGRSRPNKRGFRRISRTLSSTNRRSLDARSDWSPDLASLDVLGNDQRRPPVGVCPHPLLSEYIVITLWSSVLLCLLRGRWVWSASTDSYPFVCLQRDRLTSPRFRSDPSNVPRMCGAGGARSVPRGTWIASPTAPAIVGPIALGPPAVVIRPSETIVVC